MFDLKEIRPDIEKTFEKMKQDYILFYSLDNTHIVLLYTMYFEGKNFSFYVLEHEGTLLLMNPDTENEKISIPVGEVNQHIIESKIRLFFATLYKKQKLKYVMAQPQTIYDKVMMNHFWAMEKKCFNEILNRTYKELLKKNTPRTIEYTLSHIIENKRNNDNVRRLGYQFVLDETSIYLFSLMEQYFYVSISFDELIDFITFENQNEAMKFFKEEYLLLHTSHFDRAINSHKTHTIF